MIQLEIDSAKKRSIARTILEDLPQWFGLPEHTENYIRTAGDLPCLVAYDKEEPVGFITMKPTSIHTLEIHCMGVLKRYHRQGHGKALVHTAMKWAKDEGYRLMQVKTVELGTYDNYDRTNRFYQAMGFLELEVIPDLWDEANPCQILVACLK